MRLRSELLRQPTPIVAPPGAEPAHRQLIIPVDLGKRSDFTAIGVFEPLGVHTDVHAIVRLPLKTKYRVQAKRVAKMVKGFRAQGAAVIVVFDATGVGVAVEEMFEEELIGTGALLWAVTITRSGTKQTRHSDRSWSVPKSNLVSSVQLAIDTSPQTGQPLRLLASVGEEMRELVGTEMRGFKMTTNDNGNDSYGNDVTESDHDDVVLMAAIGCWASRELALMRVMVGSKQDGKTWPGHDRVKLRDALYQRREEGS